MTPESARSQPLSQLWLWTKRRPLVGVIALVVVVVIMGGVRQAVMANRVIRAVRTSFPSFCADGQILADGLIVTNLETAVIDPLPLEPGRYWGIRCGKDIATFQGYVAIIDPQTCAAIRPATISMALASEYQAFKYGSPMTACP